MNLLFPRRTALTALSLALGALTSFGTSQNARADVINVDFNAGTSNGPTPTYVGVGAAPDSGTVWNGLTITGASQSSNNLRNSTGGATGVSVTATGSGLGNAPTGLGASGHSASNLLLDYIRTNNSRTVTLSGLTTGTNYSLYLYGVGRDAAGSTTSNSRAVFTIGNLTQTTTGPVAATTNLTLGEDYVFFNNLTATNNSIVINYAPPTGEAFGVFNGLQLQYAAVAPVPEPSTWAMMALGVGALGLMTWKRKRSTNSDTDFVAAAI